MPFSYFFVFLGFSFPILPCSWHGYQQLFRLSFPAGVLCAVITHRTTKLQEWSASGGSRRTEGERWVWMVELNPSFLLILENHFLVVKERGKSFSKAFPKHANSFFFQVSYNLDRFTGATDETHKTRAALHGTFFPRRYSNLFWAYLLMHK